MELAKGLAIRSFHFSPFVTDSAVVIEGGDQVLLDANDAKFARLPLRQILSRYPNVDFCFRSHSSANARACYHYLDAPDEETDDNEHYLRAFPALILKQAVAMNMFGHAGISKRLHYHATKAEMPILGRFTVLWEWTEAELFPLRGNFSGRALRALLPLAGGRALSAGAARSRTRTGSREPGREVFQRRLTQKGRRSA